MVGYIRLEGVNIYANLGDTDQLSVIRGGSYFLKQAIMALIPNEEDLAENRGADYDFSEELECISKGASVGVFRTKQVIDNETELAALCHRIQHAVATDKNFRHLTFTLTHTFKQENEPFSEVEKRLTALSRFQQLQQLTIAPDPVLHKYDQPQPCELNGIRKGVQHRATPDTYFPVSKTAIPNEQRYLSESVMSRFNAGITQRRTFLTTTEGSSLTLTRYLETLASNPDQKNLDKKIALIYFDGNSFGKLRDHFINTAADQETAYQTFDSTMRALREQLLEDWTQHIETAISSSEAAFECYVNTDNPDDEQQIRFEPLLWGGDELLFVLPAWLGFEFLQFFYQATQTWGEQLGAQSLTHAGGIVFCKAKTPLFRVRNLASELAESVKEHHGGREHNFYDLMALESVDFPTESLSVYRTNTYGKTLMEQRAPFSAEHIDALSTLATLQKTLPKSQVYQLCELAQQKGGEGSLTKGVERLKSLYKEKEDYQTLIETLVLCFGEGSLASGWCWVWLREYWDYIEPLARPLKTAPNEKDISYA